MKNSERQISGWLPVTRKEMDALGWDQPDVIIFSGDAYVDHPSFGTAVIARVIEDEGFRVAIVPQPNWKDDLRDFRKMGAPRLFFAVTAGNMDSMVNHYTAARRLRSDDAYTPGGKAGFRPDYPTVVYSSILKKLFPEIPVVAGGIEASMRRLTHYDYWKDSVEPSVLLSSGADMIIYGMGEQPVRELLRLVDRGVPFGSLLTIPQTVVSCPRDEELPAQSRFRDIRLHSFEECRSDKKLFAENFVIFERESNRIEAARLLEPSGDRMVVVNPPFPPADEKEADRIWDLPFSYLPHPKYSGKGDIPAYEMIKFSVNIHRGCFGGCSFCAIAAHQGKHIIRRSEESVLKEVDRIKDLPGFSGYISDLGGPSANMYGMKGVDMKLCLKCSRPSCIWPSVCRNLDTDHSALTRLYKKVNSSEGIKKAFVGSGVRYDLLFPGFNPKAGRDEAEYLEELLTGHTSGRLKVAPEHSEPKVLHLMRKSPFALFRTLKTHFDGIMKRHGLKYGIVPYFISSHPGCTNDDMRQLAAGVRDLGIKPEQVQDFTPTPMTLSTLMYYTGFDPYTGKSVFVARGREEKRGQKEILFWYRKKEAGGNKENREGVGNKDKKEAGRKRETRGNKEISGERKAGISREPGRSRDAGRNKGKQETGGTRVISKNKGDKAISRKKETRGNREKEGRRGKK